MSDIINPWAMFLTAWADEYTIQRKPTTEAKMRRKLECDVAVRGCEVEMRVVEQTHRCKHFSVEGYEYLATNGVTLNSFSGPDLNGDNVFTRGDEGSADNNLERARFNTHTEALQYAARLLFALAEYNATNGGAEPVERAEAEQETPKERIRVRVSQDEDGTYRVHCDEAPEGEWPAFTASNGFIFKGGCLGTVEGDGTEGDPLVLHAEDSDSLDFVDDIPAYLARMFAAIDEWNAKHGA